MRSEDQIRFSVDNHLCEPGTVTKRPSIGGSGVITAANKNISVRRNCIIFCDANRCNLRMAKHRSRNMALGHNSRILWVSDIPERHLNFGIRNVFQLVLICDITNCPDARNTVSYTHLTLPTIYSV